MTAEEMWAAFRAACPDTGDDYEAWAFGDDPDGLARLVLSGTKTATSSALPCYEAEGEPLPQAGEYSVVLDSRDNAVCVTRTTKVSVLPFSQVPEAFARKEGEGNQSLNYWRKVHETFFRKKLAQIGQTFTPDMPVVCEEFEVVYPQREAIPCER